MSYRTIKLKRYQDIVNEETAAGSILPGSLVEITPNGVRNHNTAAGIAATMFALEDELQGKTTRDEYAEGDKVQVWYAQPGEEVLAVVGSSFDPAVGAYLESAGDGTLRAVTAAGEETAAGFPVAQVIGEKIEDD